MKTKTLSPVLALLCAVILNDSSAHAARPEVLQARQAAAVTQGELNLFDRLLSQADQAFREAQSWLPGGDKAAVCAKLGVLHGLAFGLLTQAPHTGPEDRAWGLVDAARTFARYTQSALGFCDIGSSGGLYVRKGDREMAASALEIGESSLQGLHGMVRISREEAAAHLRNAEDYEARMNQLEAARR